MRARTLSSPPRWHGSAADKNRALSRPGGHLVLAMPFFLAVVLLALPIFGQSTLATAAVASTRAVASTAAVAEGPHWLRPGDEIYLVSTRRSPFRHGCGPVRLDVYRFAASCQWQPAKVESLVAAASESGRTVFWVHGNRVDRYWAKRRGLEMYRALVRHDQVGVPVRLVIWSWPTEQTGGPVQDVRTKAARADSHGYQLAWLMDQIDPQAPVSLIGFSFGCRVITAALHLLDGGRLGPMVLPAGDGDAGRPRRGMHAVLMAAGMHHHWLLPGHYHGRALGQLDHLLLLNNSCDRVLRLYRFISRCSNPAALGYVGLPQSASLHRYATEIEQRDACCLAGTDHTAQVYIFQPHLMDWAWQALVQPEPVRE